MPGGVNFDKSSAAKIADAVRKVLGQPTDQRGENVPSHNSWNRFFWGQMVEGNFQEVYQTSSTGTLTWTVLPGGRTGTLSAYVQGSVASQVFPATFPQSQKAVFLVYQWFDCGVNPPAVYYAAVGDNNVLVKISGKTAQHHVYTGTIEFITPDFTAWVASSSAPAFGDTQGCLIVNLEECAADFSAVDWMLDVSTAQYAHGTIVSCEADGTPVIAINCGAAGVENTSAAADSDVWSIRSGINGANTAAGFRFDVVSRITVSGTTMTVTVRTIQIDARGRMTDVSGNVPPGGSSGVFTV